MNRIRDLLALSVIAAVLGVVSVSVAEPYRGGYDSPDPGRYDQGASSGYGYGGFAGSASGFDADRSGASDFNFTANSDGRREWYPQDRYRDQDRYGDRERSGGGAVDYWPGMVGNEAGWGHEVEPGWSGADRYRYSDSGTSSDGSRRGAYESGTGDGYDSWSAGAPAPRYRFRDDPRLSFRAQGRDDGYQFRPLTEKERERRGRQAGAPRFAKPRRHYEPEPAKRKRTETFGYEPGAPRGSFFERYYRSGP